jgi:uncharacterized protein involved in exopolysaccharide biosynthesis
MSLSNVQGHPTEIIPRAIALPGSEGQGQPSGMSLNDVLFMLFRHKWKILVCATFGILAAAGIYFLVPPQYESQAKLLVRYLVDRSAIDGLDSQGKNLGSQNANTLNSPSESAINSEVEILKSSDLAMQVATTIGAGRLVGGSGEQNTIAETARGILRDLDVTVVKGSNIISVIYRNRDPKLASEVLKELVKRYFDKHLEVHRSLDAFEFVTKEADRLRTELDRTEEELKRLKAEAGVSSLKEDTAALATELEKAQAARDAAKGEVAAQKARLDQIEKLTVGVASQSAQHTVSRPGNDIVADYQELIARVAKLREAETELLSRYTVQNRIVKVKQAQIDDTEKQRKSLEKRYPGLLLTVTATGVAQSSGPDIVSEKARLTALEATAESLKTRYDGLQERARKLSEIGPRIAQLERQKEIEDTNYKYYGASLEKARIDETLDPARMPNISIVQAPSPPDRSGRDLRKVVMGLAAGGLAAGLACALLIELVLDRTIKRPLELETRLRIPLLLSIPNFGSDSRFRLRDVGVESEMAVMREGGANAETGESFRPFCEAIRDRLGLYFEQNRMTHRPKLVAVAGLSKNAGASTLASGLAAALSDVGDGKVLLIDKPVTSKGFYNMLADFKRSDLDYVVFDMPSLGDTSSTLAMAGFMDKVLMVVEAEKSNRDAVKRAYSQLAAKSDVSVIFNKSRSYGPKWLEGEI